MIKVYKHNSLGGADYGWLKTKYHFSFARYYNPQRMGFGALRVINDDIVAPQSGFDTHPHRDMEIITFVRSGAISHKDSVGNSGRTGAGDVQVMSAGTGVFHSEFNLEDEPTTLFQIWIEPHTEGVEPRWESASFANKKAEDTLPLLVSGRAEDAGKGALFIYQDAAIYGGTLAKGQTINHGLKSQAYVVVSAGQVQLDDVVLNAGDGAELTALNAVAFKALSDAELIVIEVPAA